MTGGVVGGPIDDKTLPTPDPASVQIEIPQTESGTGKPAGEEEETPPPDFGAPHREPASDRDP